MLATMCIQGSSYFQDAAISVIKLDSTAHHGSAWSPGLSASRWWTGSKSVFSLNIVMDSVQVGKAVFGKEVYGNRTQDLLQSGEMLIASVELKKNLWPFATKSK